MIHEHMFEKFNVASARAIGLRGLHIDTFRPEGIVNELVVMLEGFVLSEQAGPVQQSIVKFEVAKFPRWVPKWLRRRWTKTERVTLTVTPKYLYPSSNLVIPEAGTAIKFRSVTLD